MASEKADLPHDTDSLPPHYASSEAFTDSPPPAYRKASTVRLQITRWICLTILLAGFLTGFFILAHSYLKLAHAPQECHCPPSIELLPHTPEALVQAKALPLELLGNKGEMPNMEAFGNGIEEDANSIQMEDARSRQMDIDIPLEEEVMEDLAAAERTIEEEVNDLQSLTEDQSEDQRDQEEPPKDVKLPIDMLLGNPALAGKDVQCKVEKKIQNLGGGILSKTIMVICDDNEDQPEETKSEIEVRPLGPVGGSSFPRPPLSLLAPIFQMMKNRAQARLQGQMKPKIVLRRLPQPINPFQQHFNGPMPSARPFPFPVEDLSQERRSFPENLPFPGNFHPNMQPHMADLHRPQEEQEAPKNMLFREDLNEPAFDEEPMMIQNDSPIRVIHQGSLPQFPEAIKQILSKIVSGREERMNEEHQENNNEGAMPHPEHLISFKAFPESPRSIEDMAPPKSKMLLPFPFRAMKIGSRGARKLNIHEEHPEDSFDLPEAVPRAIPNPVTLPSHPDLRFFPGNFIRLNMPIKSRAMTHMEMKSSPNSLVMNPSEIPEHFGPPREHSIVEEGPQMVAQESPLELVRPLQGRMGFVREIESDAEVLVHPDEVMAHPEEVVMAHSEDVRAHPDEVMAHPEEVMVHPVEVLAQPDLPSINQPEHHIINVN